MAAYRMELRRVMWAHIVWNAARDEWTAHISTMSPHDFLNTIPMGREANELLDKYVEQTAVRIAANDLYRDALRILRQRRSERSHAENDDAKWAMDLAGRTLRGELDRDDIRFLTGEDH